MNEGAQILKAMHEAEARDDKEAMRALLRKQGGRLLETVPHASIKKEARAFLDRHRETGDAGPVVRLLTGLMQIVGDYLMLHGSFLQIWGDLRGEGGEEVRLQALRTFSVPEGTLWKLLAEVQKNTPVEGFGEFPDKDTAIAQATTIFRRDKDKPELHEHMCALRNILHAYADQLGENAGYQTALGYLHGEAGRDAQRGALRGLDIPRAVLEELLQERR